MRTLRTRLSLALLPFAFVANRVFAQVFNGPGLEGGVGEASLIGGPSHMTLRGAILLLLYKVLGYLALLSVFIIVMAGAYLIVSSGSDEIKDKVKKIIIYVVVGLLIVLFARTVVGFITQAFLSE